MFAATENFMDFKFISLESDFNGFKENIRQVLGYPCY
jgi:hypothetical protein